MNGIKIEYLNGLGLIEYLNGLGLVAKNKRRIKPGRQYDVHFPKPENLTPMINDDGSVIDTVGYCEKIVRSTLNDTRKIAPLLKGATLQATCNNVFRFIYDHIQYQEDKPNVEQLRRPARTWSDRKGDCDCMSIFASSILTNLGIPHFFRIVKMHGRSWFQHIYVIVPKSGMNGKGDMTNRKNYIVIDPVLDNFDQEAPKINFKKDFEMKNLSGLSGIPIQYLNGVDNSLRFGEEFNGLEGFDGTEEELGREWDRRMKTHLVNTHNYITRNPRRVAAFYDTQKLAGAYKELIGAWDSEKAREGALDRLSANEESFLLPHLQGLGDILAGPDDRLFGLINADLSGLDGLGKSKKAVARKAAKAAKKPVAKRGHFTKIKQANKKIKATVKKTHQKAVAAHKKAGAKVKAVAKKVGKLAVKGATWPILAGTLMAMKVNFAKIGSRLYWGLFPKAEAMQHGVLPDYWEAANKSWNFIRNIYVNKLKGEESTLRKSIITGRAAKVAKRGTHGLGNIGNGLAELQGYSGLGFPPAVAAALITAGVTVLAPVTKALANNMNGKKKTANSEPEEVNENVDPNVNTDTGDDEPISQSEAASIEDNYNNEVVENQPEQEPEADGSVDSEEAVEGLGGEREYDQFLGDLGKKIKSKPGTETQKRVKKDKVAKKQAKSAKKAAKKQASIAKKQDKINKMAAKKPKTAARKQKRLDKKTASIAKQKEEKHIKEAEALKKMPKKTLVQKLKSGISKLKSGKLKNATPEQIEEIADSIQNKSTEEIVNDAKQVAENYIKTGSGSAYVNEDGEETGYKDPGKEKSDAPKGSPKEEGETESEGMGTGSKLALGAAALLGLALLLKPKKKNAPATAGLSGTKKELIHEGKRIQKMLAKKGERLKHGYTVANRKKKVTKARILKIK